MICKLWQRILASRGRRSWNSLRKLTWAHFFASQNDPSVWEHNLRVIKLNFYIGTVSERANSDCSGAGRVKIENGSCETFPSGSISWKVKVPLILFNSTSDGVNYKLSNVKNICFLWRPLVSWNFSLNRRTSTNEVTPQTHRTLFTSMSALSVPCPMNH